MLKNQKGETKMKTQTKTMTVMDKKEALAKFLKIKQEGIVQSGEEFEVDNESYRVLTDREADEAVEEYITDSLWAFNADFIAAHTRNGLSEKAIKALGKLQGELCEDANDMILNLIVDMDGFIADAINADGRGHFLAGYDFKEGAEAGRSGELFFIYRVN